ncbi:DMT family transporter [Ferruginibacter albus]|uniref:DMT family transporter n=1 Tax=Ferruginibacter albus TaxID=2875540 RepID=UPI001CC4F372|nr:DMT family transporter [Ferruginibacter albus]UAY53590.1 DMT family transporter [Ferruginibacter albus]
MNNQYLLIALSFISGFLIPVQAASNAALSKAIGNPIITSLSVFIIGLITLVLYMVVTKTTFPSIAAFKNAPWYGFMGGLIIAFYVVVITFVIPRLGVGAAIGLVITGQVIAAITIDHFGLLNAAVRVMDVKRFIGALLMIAGIYLVMKK